MLKQIPKILSPDLVAYLMEMGHGDELVIADANFPAHRIGQRVVRMDGHGVPVIWDEYKKILEESHPGAAIKEFERFEFYDQAEKAYLVIQTGESALYGNIILKKGVL